MSDRSKNGMQKPGRNKPRGFLGALAYSKSPVKMAMYSGALPHQESLQLTCTVLSGTLLLRIGDYRGTF